jgi:hypothetical protein
MTKPPSGPDPAAVSWPRPDDEARTRKREANLDEALEETFPASDPISPAQPD